ncbi:MAG: RsmB/NOP family class I SAM-dependent RNA methyltransferase [Candidatus Omnitrophota bacterium]|nr:RsmB/NOP family class I SAM-dependent RNA methyltransferase [Candidatus Omnitrophota bacterium]
MKAIIYNLPAGFLEKLKMIYPSDYPKICETFLHKKEQTFRINYLKTDLPHLREDLGREGIKYREIHWPKGSFILKSAAKDLRKSPLYLEGKVYMQNASSMIPPILLSPQKGEKILDMCAAPGAKTTQIASLAGSDIELIALEKMEVRFQKLLATLRIQGIDFVKARLLDGFWVKEKYPGYFDKVLLDAPCSGEALFDVRNHKTYGFWNEKRVKEVSRRQKILIASAIASLRKGGELVYSTCTFSPEENEEVIDWALSKFKEIEMVPIQIPISNIKRGLVGWKDKKYPSDLRLTLRILPNEIMEGFFIAKLRKA